MNVKRYMAQAPGPDYVEVVRATDYDALKEQRDFAIRELNAILFMLQREKGKEEK